MCVGKSKACVIGVVVIGAKLELLGCNSYVWAEESYSMRCNGVAILISGCYDLTRRDIDWMQLLMYQNLGGLCTLDDSCWYTCTINCMKTCKCGFYDGSDLVFSLWMNYVTLMLWFILLVCQLLIIFVLIINSGCRNPSLQLLFCYLAYSLSLCLYLCYIYAGRWFVIWCNEAGYFQNKSLKLMGIDYEWMGALHGLYGLGKIQILKDWG